MQADDHPSITLITESYNFESGQSWRALERSLFAAVEAVSGVGGGPHEVLVLDCSRDPRALEAVSRASVPSPHRLRYLRVPEATSYDTIKDLGALLAANDVVAYLDGDCVPSATPAAWLAAMVDELVRSGAPGVGGTTVYEGRSPYRLASSALDFGYLFDDAPGRPIGCYASNNVCFWRSTRSAEPMASTGLRSNCYLHAQSFVQRGTPMVRASAPAATVTHEMPALFDERLRRGYDAVVVARTSDEVHEFRFFKGRRLRDSTIGIAHFIGVHWRSDADRCRRICAFLSVSRVRYFAALVMTHLLRCLEIPGMLQAIWGAPDGRWNHTVDLDQALEFARSSSPPHLSP